MGYWHNSMCSSGEGGEVRSGEGRQQRGEVRGPCTGIEISSTSMFLDCYTNYPTQVHCTLKCRKLAGAIHYPWTGFVLDFHGTCQGHTCRKGGGAGGGGGVPLS